MKTVNTIYFSQTHLKSFIKLQNFTKDKNILIQIFSSIIDKNIILNIVKTIKTFVPRANIIGATSDGEIIDGIVQSNSIVISFTQFDNTNIRSISIPFDQNISDKEIGKLIAQKIFLPSTKAMIMFINRDIMHSNDILYEINQNNPHVVIAGSMSYCNIELNTDFVLLDNKILNNCIVGILLDNENLKVNTLANFSWQNIGKIMTVTKSNKNRVYTIDNEPAINIYHKYLNTIIDSDNMNKIGYKFPIIIHKNGLQIPRGIYEVHSDGSIEYSGEVEENSQIQFTFGSPELIIEKSLITYQELENIPIQSMFIYSSVARKRYIPAHISLEIKPLQSICAIVGFFGFGQFFHSQNSNEYYNISTTILTLSEKNILKHNIKLNTPKFIYTDQIDTLKTLTKFIENSSDEYNETTKLLEYEKKIRVESEYNINHKNQLIKILTHIDECFSEEMNLDNSFNTLIHIIGKYSESDYVAIFQYNNENNLFYLTHEWLSNNSHSYLKYLQNIDIEKYTWLRDKLIQNKDVSCNSLEDLPTYFIQEKNILIANNINSLIIVPILANKKLIGGIVSWKLINQKFWNNEDKTLLRISALILSQYIARNNLEKIYNMRSRQLNMLSELNLLSIEYENLDSYLTKIVIDVIPESMQYPENLLIKIEYQQKIYSNGDIHQFTNFNSSLTASLIILGEYQGNISFYSMKKNFFKNNFEQQFINEIAIRLSFIIERRLYSSLKSDIINNYKNEEIGI